MNYAKIIPYDFANGEGVRTSLFVSGCTNNCPGCFNLDEQSFSYGQRFTDKDFTDVLQAVKKPEIYGLSILGGDPLCQETYDLTLLAGLCLAVQNLHKTIWLWTGFVWEDVFKDTSVTGMYRRGLLLNCNVVVDGPYLEKLADRALPWRGSSNQRIIDVQKTRQQKQIILYER